MHDNVRLGPSASSKRPYAVVGAGAVSASLWKDGEPRGGWRYGFNLFRMSPRNGHVTQRFRPHDLHDLVKLFRVLAHVLVDDGCLSDAVMDQLSSLYRNLDSCVESSDRLPRAELDRLRVEALCEVLAQVRDIDFKHLLKHEQASSLNANLLVLEHWLDQGLRHQS